MKNTEKIFYGNKNEEELEKAFEEIGYNMVDEMIKNELITEITGEEAKEKIKRIEIRERNLEISEKRYLEEKEKHVKKMKEVSKRLNELDKRDKDITQSELELTKIALRETEEKAIDLLDNKLEENIAERNNDPEITPRNIIFKWTTAECINAAVWMTYTSGNSVSFSSKNNIFRAQCIKKREDIILKSSSWTEKCYKVESSNSSYYYKFVRLTNGRIFVNVSSFEMESTGYLKGCVTSDFVMSKTKLLDSMEEEVLHNSLQAGEIKLRDLNYGTILRYSESGCYKQSFKAIVFVLQGKYSEFLKHNKVYPFFLNLFKGIDILRDGKHGGDVRSVQMGLLVLDLVDRLPKSENVKNFSVELLHAIHMIYPKCFYKELVNCPKKIEPFLYHRKYRTTWINDLSRDETVKLVRENHRFFLELKPESVKHHSSIFSQLYSQHLWGLIQEHLELGYFKALPMSVLNKAISQNPFIMEGYILKYNLMDI